MPSAAKSWISLLPGEIAFTDHDAVGKGLRMFGQQRRMNAAHHDTGALFHGMARNHFGAFNISGHGRDADEIALTQCIQRQIIEILVPDFDGDFIGHK